MSQLPSQDSLVVEPLSEAEQVVGKISELQTALQRQLPEYSSILHSIHTELQRSPDTVHFLTDEQIGVIVAGLQKKTGMFIAAETAKKPIGSGGKRGGKIGLDDL